MFVIIKNSIFIIAKQKPKLKNNTNIFLKILFSICVLKFNIEYFCLKYLSAKTENKKNKDK